MGVIQTLVVVCYKDGLVQLYDDMQKTVEWNAMPGVVSALVARKESGLVEVITADREGAITVWEVCGDKVQTVHVDFLHS